MDSKEHLKDVVKSLINDDSQKAEEHLHSYITVKTKEIINKNDKSVQRDDIDEDQ